MEARGERRRGGNECVTHLIGSVYLRGSPSGVLHIVLLHLGADFRAGSDVTCRLEGGGGETKKRREMGKQAQNTERKKGEVLFFFVFFPKLEKRQ